MSEKPLFLPLKTKYYEAFKSGEKTEELRKYGGRWTEKTCFVGRKVTLSKGYGKQNRLKGVIVSFETKHGTKFGMFDRFAINDCFKTLDITMAIIGIKIET
ncbi:MAG: hypothetical protein ACNI27_08595 [Desulfovibrio sp.]